MHGIGCGNPPIPLPPLLLLLLLFHSGIAICNLRLAQVCASEVRGPEAPG